MPPNNLAPPEQAPIRASHDLDLVSQSLQTPHRGLIDALFEIDGGIRHVARIRESRSDAHSRSVQGGLRAEAEDDLVEEDLDVALGLHEASHDAVDAVKGLVGGIGDHGGDDGVVGSFIRCEDVRVVGGLKSEIRGAVLQGETTPFRDDGGAETRVIAVDKGDGVAELVGAGEIDRVRGEVGRGPVVEVGAGGVRVKEFGALGEIFGTDHALGGNFGNVRVCNPPIAIGECDAKGFDNGVDVGRGIVVFAGELGDLAGLFQLLNDAQCHESYNSLSVGRVLPQFDAAVVGRVVHVLPVGCGYILSVEFQADGLRLFCTLIHVVLQIFQRQMSTEIPHHFDELFSNSSGVVPSLSFRTHLTERPGQCRILHYLARCGCSTPIGGIRVVLQHLGKVGRRIADGFFLCLPEMRLNLTDGESLVCQFGRGFQNLGQAELPTAKPFHRVHPTRRSAGHRHCMRTRQGNLSHFPIFQPQALPDRF